MRVLVPAILAFAFFAIVLPRAEGYGRSNLPRSICEKDRQRQHFRCPGTFRLTVS
jgi:hypothetical protein